MTNIILFGPPGSGKGTQAKLMAKKYNLLHISTGDMFRSEMRENTTLGRKAKDYIKAGELVPDEVTIAMLRNQVDSHPDVSGYIFDGFPRTIEQAKALDSMLEEIGEEITGLIALNVSREEIVSRILERGKSSGRPDDNDKEIIENRIQVYLDETTPVFDYYMEKDKAERIDGLGTVEEVKARLFYHVNVIISDKKT